MGLPRRYPPGLVDRRGFLTCLAVPCAAAQQPVFRVETRLVEFLVTVRDHRGRYVEGLARTDFEVTDGGESRCVEILEEYGASVACAMLLDTTGSMARVLPVLKSAAIRLVGAFRPQDSVSVYRFANDVEKLQDLTTDKASAVRAILNTKPSGGTALFDAVSAVTAAFAPIRGVKVIVLFTDGSDNSSHITGPSAGARARRAGVPIYAIAQGDALEHHRLLLRLEELANATGGRSYTVRKPQEMIHVFDDIYAEISHIYLIAYRPPSTSSQGWRAVRIAVRGHRDYRLRTREGYFPE